jgi:IS30 family transposase
MENTFRVGIYVCEMTYRPGRGEAGHWEGDLVICKCTRPVLVLHERKSRVHARCATHRENRRRNHLSDARGVRPH